MNDITTYELDGIIKDNNSLILSLANRFSAYSSREDLYQVGILGIINAYHNFDENYGCKFSTYAYPYIEGEMKKFVREDRGIKVGRDLVYLGARIEKARELIRQKLRKEPTVSEISQFLEIDEEKIIEALQATTYVKSIDEPINDDGKELTIKDLVYKEETYDQLDLICLKDEFRNLSDAEKALLILRYGKDKTQMETARFMKMSQVQVSRSEQKILSNLKNKLYN